MAAVGKKLLATRLESLRERFADCANRFRVDCLMIQNTAELPITRKENDALVAKFRNERLKERSTHWYGVGGRRFEIDGGWVRRALTLVGPEQLSDLRALGHDASGLMVEAGHCPAPSWFTPPEVWAKSGDNLWWYTLFEWSLSRPKFGDAEPRLLVAGKFGELVVNHYNGSGLSLPQVPSLRVSIDNVAQASCELLGEVIDVGFQAIRSEIQKANKQPRLLATSTVDQWCSFDVGESAPAAKPPQQTTEAAGDSGGKANGRADSTPARPAVNGGAMTGSSYPYDRTLELERRDPQAFKIFRRLYRELHEHQQQIGKPTALETKCRTTLRRYQRTELPWLTTDQIKWLASSFAEYRPPSAQARVSLYDTFQDHWRQSHPLTPAEIDKALSGDDQQQWPRRVDPLRGMAYLDDLDGPLPLRDESDLACWIRDKLTLLPPEDSPKQSRGDDIKLRWLNDDIRDAVFWLRHFGHTVELPKRCQDFDSADRELNRLLDLAESNRSSLKRPHGRKQRTSDSSGQSRPIVANETRLRPFYPPDAQILEAMNACGPNDKDSCWSATEIAGKMHPPRTRDAIRDGLKRLLKGGYVKSVVHGNQGGYYLTSTGRKKLPSAKAKRKLH